MYKIIWQDKKKKKKKEKKKLKTNVSYVQGKNVEEYNKLT